jgi:hypothetical protein
MDDGAKYGRMKSIGANARLDMALDLLRQTTLRACPRS